jgi:alkylation response protein AidB-like acyl-CoA dehydrogenase
VTPADALAAARALAPRLAERSREVEEGRGVPPDLLDELRASGLFRMWLPVELGGDELDLATFVEVIEALATGDASCAWTVMIGASSAAIAGLVPERCAREMYADPDTILGGALAPKGRAERVDGGWRVSGQWPFISGGRHCGWLGGGCLVVEGGRPVMTETGGPQLVTVMFPRADVEILDTWDVAGLCGTASHDMRATDVLVPDHRTLDGDDPWVPGPLFRIPLYGLLGVALAGVPLGIARAALDELIDLAGAKRPTGTPTQRLADQPLVHDRVARAEAGLAAARCYLLDAVSTLHAEAVAGPPSLAARTTARLAVSHAVDASVAAVDAAYSLAGGSAIYRSSPLQRHLRDVHTATQHLLLSPTLWPAAGKVLLGAATEAALF